MEENPRDNEPHPNDEAEKTDNIYGGEPTDALLPELSQVGHQSDGKESQQKENLPKREIPDGEDDDDGDQACQDEDDDLLEFFLKREQRPLGLRAPKSFLPLHRLSY